MCFRTCQPSNGKGLWRSLPLPSRNATDEETHMGLPDFQAEAPADQWANPTAFYIYHGVTLVGQS